MQPRAQALGGVNHDRAPKERKNGGTTDPSDSQPHSRHLRRWWQRLGLSPQLPSFPRARTATLKRSTENLLRRALARQFQCAPHWLNHAWIEGGIRMLRAKTIVKNLTYQRRASEDTAGHGHRDSARVRKQPPE